MFFLAEKKQKTAKTEVQRKAIENEYGACYFLFYALHIIIMLFSFVL